jgi:glycosyltransferase involved in cell wall biosynthesis
MTQRDVAGLLQKATIFLHASETSLDKAVLEAMACGCLVVSSSPAAHQVLPHACVCAPDQMAERVLSLLRLPGSEQDGIRHQLRQIVVQHHSLARLVQTLLKEMLPFVHV